MQGDIFFTFVTLYMKASLKQSFKRNIGFRKSPNLGDIIHGVALKWFKNIFFKLLEK